MTARVLFLDAHRRNPAPSCGCPQHRLEALADRTREAIDEHDGELLVSWPDVASALHDVLTTVADVLGTQQGGLTPDARR